MIFGESTHKQQERLRWLYMTDKWDRWFAWFPVVLRCGRIAWWQNVERQRKIEYRFYGFSDDGCYNYRECRHTEVKH